MVDLVQKIPDKKLICFLTWEIIDNLIESSINFQRILLSVGG